MAFDIRRLDQLTYDDAEPLLEDYIDDVVEQFLQSSIGEAYANTHPEAGEWTATFVEMAFIYQGLTPPKMTKGDVQRVMEEVLPRKLTLFEPSEAEDAVSELVAFWNFLKQDYGLRSAGAIVKYLLTIEDKFPAWMFDPNRGGMAKNFMMQGMQAGFDMTTPEGLAAFQAEYNQQIQANAPTPFSSSTVPMTAPPPEVQLMLDQLGVELPEVGQPVDPAALMGQILSAAMQLEPSLYDEEGAEPSAPDQAFFRALRSQMMGEPAEEDASLSDEEIAILKAQTITETEPGSILQDFQTVLEFIGPKGVTVSGKRHQLALKLLGELNQRLSNPIELALKRPQQKSYPPIHGLYLLLRATGIVKIVAKGKQHRLVLNPEIYESWQQLNPTERYCTLLEAWLVRGHEEMLGEERSGPFNEGDRCLRGWPMIAAKKHHSYSKYPEQEQLHYWLGYLNLALMEMFGLLKITSGKPAAGKGWRIRRIEALPFGRALMGLVRNAYWTSDLTWLAQTDPTVPFNELQPALQPYFPEWQKTLAVPSRPFRAGRHIFKVSLGNIWRRIAISGEATLAHLSNLILTSVDFDSDHLDQFTYTNDLGRKVQVTHPYADGDFSTDEVKIGSLPLSEGSIMQYVFDFGDWWEFQVQLETIETDPESTSGLQKTKTSKRRQSESHQPLGEILEVHGEAPPQYPDFDEEW